MAELPGWALVAGLLARVRSLVRSLRRRDAMESEILEEFRSHVAMRAEALVREGVPEEEARRRAHVEFGHMHTHREEARASRGLRLFDQIRFSWLDVKLGLRMLVKHPLLSLAAVFALAVGIPIGLAPSHVAAALEAPLPGDRENRVRAIRLWDPATIGVSTTGYGEFTYWSERLEGFSALAAFRSSAFNVASEDGRATPVSGARLSASAFNILRAAPLLGRPLNAGDVEASSTDVVVIGHALWVSRFGSDPGIIGSTIRVGSVPHTVVGVMPATFRFPADEQIWLPLKEEFVAATGSGTWVRIIGRLAEGTTEEQAQRELSAAGLPFVAEAGESRDRLRPEVVPFGLLFLGLPRGGLDALPEYRFVQLLALALLLVACGNVAMLVYARTATRFKEMAIRTALGASRGRIVSQVFAETLVLAVVAAAVGVFTVDWLLRHVNIAAIAGASALPYWLTLTVTKGTVVRALVLAAISATVAGVIPALRITGQAVHQNIRGRSGVRFGGMTGALVIADIAVSVAAVGLAIAIGGRAADLREDAAMAGIPATEYLAVEFRMAEEGAVGRSNQERLATTQRALVAGLEQEPEIIRVAVASVLPRMDHRSRPIEIEGQEKLPDSRLRWVRLAQVDVDYFDALGQTVLSGRDFNGGDVQGARTAVIVNTAFAARLIEGRDPIGQRIRFQGTSGAGDSEWSVIVGVVGHLGVNMLDAERGEAVYVPAAAGEINPMQLGIRSGVVPLTLTRRVREIASQVDSDLVMGDAVALNEIHQGDWYLVVMVAAGLVLLVGVLVALAATGIYAMLSLSVSERTREIGIRAALGATKRALVLTILRRSLVQIGVGAALGLPIAAFVMFEPSGGESSVASFLLALGMAAGIVVVVAGLSCVVPTLRVLAIEASEAMRAEV